MRKVTIGLIGSPRNQPKPACLIWMTDNTLRRLRFDPDRDVNDGVLWSEADVANLRASIEHGDTPTEAAMFLGRAGTIADVEPKAADLGLSWEPYPRER